MRFSFTKYLIGGILVLTFHFNVCHHIFHFHLQKIQKMSERSRLRTTTRQLEALVAFLENNKANLAENRKLSQNEAGIVETKWINLKVILNDFEVPKRSVKEWKHDCILLLIRLEELYRQNSINKNMLLKSLLIKKKNHKKDNQMQNQ
jgi:hypothetical protein